MLTGNHCVYNDAENNPLTKVPYSLVNIACYIFKANVKNPLLISIRKFSPQSSPDLTGWGIQLCLGNQLNEAML